MAEKYLKAAHNIEIVAFVSSIGNVAMEPMTTYGRIEDEAEWLGKWKKWWGYLKNITRAEVDSNEVRCPDAEIAQKMREVSFLNWIMLWDASSDYGLFPK